MFWKKPPASTSSDPAVKPSRDELIAQAKAAVAAAKKELGPETIAKMQNLLAQQQQKQKAQAAAAYKAAETAGQPKTDPSPAERARELIKHMDKQKLADYIRATSREED